MSDGGITGVGRGVLSGGRAVVLTPQQIARKFALPAVPTHITDVDATDIPARVGIVGPNFGSQGGGVQIQLLSRGASFNNPRPINGVVE